MILLLMDFFKQTPTFRNFIVINITFIGENSTILTENKLILEIVVSKKWEIH